MPRHLSDRQLEIVRRIARGEQMREIAEAMKISYNTVDSHRQAAMNKLSIHTSVGLTHWALMKGLIELGDVEDSDDDRHLGVLRMRRGEGDTPKATKNRPRLQAGSASRR